MVFGKITSRLFGGFTADELAELTAMMERMSSNLNAANDLPGR
jgi:hypothetical protein